MNKVSRLSTIFIALLCASCSFKKTTNSYWGSEIGRGKSREQIIQRIETKKGSMSVANNAMVVSADPRVADTSLSVLKSGGNAMDAFVGGAAMEHVLAPGTISLAGSMGLLYYEAKTGKTYYLNAGLDKPRNCPDKFYFASDMATARSALVPGIIAGLYVATQRFGSQPFAQIISPSINAAKQGIEINQIYAGLIKYRQSVLGKSDYGKNTFFHKGQPLAAGDKLKQPALAKALEGLAKEGASYFYTGEWGNAFVKTVAENNGVISTKDMESYTPTWSNPLIGNFKGYEIHTAPPRNNGGIRLLLALKIAENFNLGQLGHFSESAESLYYMVQIFRTLAGGNWFYDLQKITNTNFVQGHLTSAYAAELADKIRNKRQNPAAELAAPKGSHSSHLIVVDKNGNIATGTYTIESLPWGSGIFVMGVPVNNAAALALATPNGERIVEPFDPHIVFKNGKPYIVGGAFDSSLFPADFEVLINILEYGFDLEKASLLPRFGNFSLNLQTYQQDTTTNYLDKRVPEKLVKSLESQGIHFQQQGYVDTGMWYGVLIDSEKGKIFGMPDPWLDGTAKGY